MALVLLTLGVGKATNLTTIITVNLKSIKCIEQMDKYKHTTQDKKTLMLTKSISQAMIIVNKIRKLILHCKSRLSK